MSVNREDLTSLKESFWKEPKHINESPLFNPRLKCKKCGEEHDMYGKDAGDGEKCKKCGGPNPHREAEKK